VRSAVTHFATSLLTLTSRHRHKQGLRSLFVSAEWHANKLATSEEGKLVERTALSVPFWKSLKNCLKASQPLLIALRIAYDDDTPAAPQIMIAMDNTKKAIKKSLNEKPQLLNEVLGYYRYPGTRVPSIPSQTVYPGPVRGKTPCPVQDPHPDQALTLPRKMPWACHVPSFSSRSGLDRSLGSASPCGRCSHTRSPLRDWAQSASWPAPSEDVAQERPLCHHCPHACHPHSTDRTSRRVSRQDTTK
jgi:hypothetical protein